MLPVLSCSEAGSVSQARRLPKAGFDSGATQLPGVALHLGGSFPGFCEVMTGVPCEFQLEHTAGLEAAQ